jgi:WD40 repeat protein
MQLLARILHIWCLVRTYTCPCCGVLTTGVASSDHVARLWDLETSETVRQYNGHHKAVVCIALNDRNLDYVDEGDAR